jgi:hypothetical protein
MDGQWPLSCTGTRETCRFAWEESQVNVTELVIVPPETMRKHMPSLELEVGDPERYFVLHPPHRPCL